MIVYKNMNIFISPNVSLGMHGLYDLGPVKGSVYGFELIRVSERMPVESGVFPFNCFNEFLKNNFDWKKKIAFGQKHYS